MPKAPEYSYLPEVFDLEPELLDQLSSRPGVQRCVVGRYELLLIVHEVPKPGSHDRSPVVFWRREEGHWVDSQGNRGLKPLAELEERFNVRVQELQNQLNFADEFAEIFEVAKETTPLARCARNFAMAVEQALAQDEDSRDLRVLRDRMREIERGAELLHLEAKLTLDYRKALHAEPKETPADVPDFLVRMIRANFLLSVVTIFAVPLILFVGMLCVSEGSNAGVLLVIIGTLALLVALGISASKTFSNTRNDK